MGKGDRKTRRGKIAMGTYGNKRRPVESKNKPKSEVVKQPQKS